jgi:DNA polymerase I-like protein with 3'-5' exonuclease and polymerase domains
MDTLETFIFRKNDKEDNIKKGIKMLAKADFVVGHNIIAFDIPAIQIVYPKFKVTGEIKDTLVLSRLVRANQKDRDWELFHKGVLPGKHIGKHTLAAWGFRLELMKGDYSDARYAYAKEQGWDEQKTHEYVWGSWNQDMEDYCVQDVDVTTALWNMLSAEDFSQESIEFEHQIHDLMAQQERNGFPFDREGAEKLASELETERDRLKISAEEHFGSWYCPDKKRELWPAWDSDETTDIKAFLRAMHTGGKEERKNYKDRIAKICGQELPKMNTRNKGPANKKYTEYWLNQSFGDRKKCLQVARLMGILDNNEKLYADDYPLPGEDEDFSRRVWGVVTEHKNSRNYQTHYKKNKAGRLVSYFDTYEGARLCKIKRKDFNVASRHNIVDRFTTLYNWKPEEFTDAGAPSVDDTVLRSMEFENNPTAERMAETLAEVFYYNKRLGQIKTGKNAWLETVSDHGLIHCHTNTGGTVSGRCSHIGPNLGQVPAVKIGKDKKVLKGRDGDHGWDCRNLFRVPDGWVQVGCDLSGIEFRCLAELVCRHDNGAMINSVLHGDVHTDNWNAADLESRDIAKRCLYCLMYGGGDWKLGHTAYPFAKDGDKARIGREIRDKLMKGLPALAQAIKDTQKQSKQGYLIGLDGRKVYSRSPHSALNLRLQHNAAMIAKKWALLTNEYLIEAGFRHGWDGDYAFLAFVHDEIQTAVRPDIATQVAELSVKAANDTGHFFNFQCPVDAEYKIGMNWAECH